MRTIDLSKIQAEIGAWSRCNFPGKTKIQPAMGCVEEVGELTHAILKRSQGIRGTVEEHDAAEKDAIADCGIFLLDLAEQLGVQDLSVAWRVPGPGHEMPKRLACVLNDASNLLSMVAGLPGYASMDPRERIRNLAQSLAVYADGRDWDFLELLEATWAEVRQRDWVLWPKSGKPPEASAS